MPRKQVARRAKRTIRRKRMMKKRPTTLVNRANLTPFPSRFITTMKYAEAVQVSGIGVRSYTWNLNSLFDPNRTGLGHQPYGYDQLCGTVGLAPYNRYRVFKVDYVVSVLTDTYNNHYCILPSNNSPPPISNVSEARENPRAQYAIQNVGGTVKKIVGSVYLPALTGKTKSQYMSDDSYQAVFNANPGELMTLNVYAQGVNDDESVPMTHTINILLKYHCEVYDPHNLDQS